ncbi:MAG: hypothetical protein ACAI44_18125 [Candidatus Sericytochromatia bacterium]
MAIAANQLETIAFSNRGTQIADACFRAGISRAYYAAYHHVLAYSSEQRPPFDASFRLSSPHERLPGWLKNQIKSRRFGDDLFVCKSLRHAADYRDALSYTDPNGNASRNMGPFLPEHAYAMVSRMVAGIINEV